MKDKIFLGSDSSLPSKGSNSHDTRSKATQISREIKSSAENVQADLKKQKQPYEARKKKAQEQGEAFFREADRTYDPPTTRNWMSFVDSETSLADINMVGTHDAGAYFDVKPVDLFWKDQDRTIAEQLTDGIRLLDIRCVAVDNCLDIYHGVIDQMLPFSRVCSDCYQFLTLHPSETIIMSIKDESVGFLQKASKVIKKILNSPADWDFTDAFLRETEAFPQYWYMDTTIPQLKDVRGKIVLMRRFPVTGKIAGQPLGLVLDNNKTVGDIMVHVQDDYEKAPLSEKWNSVKSLLDQAGVAGYPSKSLFLNYCNVYNLGEGILPPKAAAYINPLVDKYVTANGHRKYGWLLMDFYKTATVFRIARTNFSQ